ncbi:hypothetical protein [Novosphingobium album (ex Liu et al. 2023)]|uniref:Uncharacterized protein n=1 Tax=Novosphingobium album (ex Liu et al. 2023) TaxID=3031130 RepID=A0ABT5WWT4_9SPHN|nr:hypothetical protein [Novosphingobium album (ex Liu et al. 2023)]MDE8654357.1 hypothetical protein [Novosphingobium album (ex Liu et al. 2023)]
MTVGMRWGWLLGSLAALTIVVLAYAWIDGGREPVRPIAVPVPVPEIAR